VAGIEKKKGDPGRTPKIFGPLILGIFAGGGVRMGGVSVVLLDGDCAGLEAAGGVLGVVDWA
jgi:hypothetical protein